MCQLVGEDWVLLALSINVDLFCFSYLLLLLILRSPGCREFAKNLKIESAWFAPADDLICKNFDYL